MELITDNSHILPPIEKINLAEKLSRIHDHWSPKIVADLNENHLKLVKLKGVFSCRLWVVGSGSGALKLKTDN